MNPKEFLNQPINVIVATGYPACLNCGKYFNHPIVYCPTCGRKIIRWKDISISDFIEKTCANGDSGPLNTLWYYLRRIQGIPKEMRTLQDYFFSFTEENQAIYDYVKKVWKQAQKKSKGDA